MRFTTKPGSLLDGQAVAQVRRRHAARPGGELCSGQTCCNLATHQACGARCMNVGGQCCDAHSGAWCDAGTACSSVNGVLANGGSANMGIALAVEPVACVRAVVPTGATLSSSLPPNSAFFLSGTFEVSDPTGKLPASYSTPPAQNGDTPGCALLASSLLFE
ncbi:hypothetical protein BOTBODRAFT_552516 [Botryobasidium botryosum FD-172 SS1]|uniref:Uncharacterized protein n=1 Tax=Botryobasidium botryosum (strain FD-172 SS1) TaxID=930990 RepID=A0A067N316_BOTB1|nr:hypothetical protein BOTBODRAFT_552516 [Botryobasidium botryosum FD-172 SS1]